MKRFITAILLGLFLVFFACEVYADPQNVIAYRPLVIQAGTYMEFEAWSAVHPFRPMVREDFDIEIVETWKGGVSFRYSVAESDVGGGSGIETLSSLDDCTSLDPWWEPMRTEHDTRCEFWLPRTNYWELLTTRKTFFKIDTLARRDDSVRWMMGENVQYSCEVNGVSVILDAFQVRTTRGDEIIILADPDNAMVLSIRSMYFAWKLKRMRNA